MSGAVISAVEGVTTSPRRGSSRTVTTRAFFLIFLAAAGLLQTWQLRHRIFSDGIPYLDIATYYAHGDFQHALNEYWSPLYSWVLALVILIFRPTTYWQAASLHVVNYITYLTALAGFELWLTALIRMQTRMTRARGLDEATVRVLSYSAFLTAGIALVGIGYCSPDMIAMAIGFFLAYLLVRMEEGRVGVASYLWFGVLLALGYLSRSAFLPLTLLYFAIAAMLAWRRHMAPVRAIVSTGIAAIVVAAPFVLALSIQKGHLDFGATGPPNYAWEVLGAARSTNWQGGPGNLGTPLHPSHKVLGHPAMYTFASPVPGTYPLWYEPSYWYAGIRPYFSLAAQMRVLALSLRDAGYLFLRSIIPYVCIGVLPFMGLRRWSSWRGIPGYWFLLLPSIAYIGLYLLVYLDQRYIAGSLAILWVTLLVSVAVPQDRWRERLNLGVSLAGWLFFGFLAFTNLLNPARATARDLLHRHEDEWNMQWMIAERLHTAGIRAGDRVAYIGSSMDADWARLDGVRIVAEVPIVWDRYPELMRRIKQNTREVDAFWNAPAGRQEEVFAAFREAGAVMVVTDRLPDDKPVAGWTRVLPPGTPHMAWSEAQIPRAPGTAYRWLLGQGDTGLKRTPAH